MAVVGSAEIVVRAITTQVKRDIEKAFKDLRPTLEAEGKKAGKLYSDSFNESVKGQLGNGLADSLSDAARKATDGLPDIVDDVLDDVSDDVDQRMTQAGDRGGKGFLRGFLKTDFANEAIKASRAFTKVFFIGNVVGAGISALVGSLSALVSSLFSVAASASQAAGALAVIPGIYLSIGQAAGVAKLAMGGIGDALKDGLAAASATGEDVKAATEKFNESLKNLSPAAQSFVKYLIEIKDRFKVIKTAAQEGLFPGLEESLRTIVGGNAIKTIAAAFGRTAELVGEAAKGIADVFALGAKNNLGAVLEANNRILEIFVLRGGAGENVLAKLVRLFFRFRLAIAPVTERFAVWISSLIRGAAWATNTAKEVDNLTNFFNKAGDRAALLGKIGGNLIDIFIGLGKAASPAGTGLLESFRKYTQGLSKTVNVKQENLRAYFKDVAETLRAVSNLTRKIGGALADLGDNEGLTGFIKGLEPAVESFRNIGNSMASAGPQLAEFISQLAEILEALADTEALQLFFEVLSSVLGVVIDFIKTDFGGWLLATVGTVAAITRSIALMRSVAVLAFKILIGGTLSAIKSFDKLTLSIGRTTKALQQSQAYATAGTRLQKLGASASIARLKFQELAGSVAKMALPMAGVTLATTDATKSITGINSVSGALIGAMFGPWGAALGFGAGLAVDFAKSNDDLFNSLKSLNELLEQGAKPKQLDLGLAEAQKQLEEFKGNIQGDKSIFNLQADFQTLKNEAENIFGDSDLQEGEEQLSALEDAVDKAKNAFKTARQFAHGFSGQVERVGLVAFDSSHGVRALGRAINKQQEILRRSIDAEYAFESSMRDVRQRLKENKLGFDSHTEAGEANLNILISVADALNRGDGSWEHNRKTLEKVAHQMGATKEETQKFVLAFLSVPKARQTKWSLEFDKDTLGDLLRNFREFPEELKSQIRTEGIPQTIKEINGLVAKYKLTEEQREALVDMKDKATEKIQKLKRELKTLEEHDTTLTVWMQIKAINNLVDPRSFGRGSGPAQNQPSPPGGLDDLFPSQRQRRNSNRNSDDRTEAVPNVLNPRQNTGTVIQIERIEAHDYKDFTNQLERRRRRRGLGGLS